MATDAVVGCLEVEVQGLNGAFYRAFVLDLVDNDVLIRFEDDWLPNKQVPVSRIRLPDHSERPLPLAWDGCEDVEVLSRAKDTEACGWWPAIILEWSRGSEVCTIQYKVDKNFTEMVNTSRLRVPNKNPPLQLESFFKCVIEVPEEVRHACEDMALHRDLLHACRANILRGDNKAGTLTLLSTSSETVTRARMLADLHVRSLQTKVMLKQRNTASHAANGLMALPQGVARPFTVPETPNPRLITETFSIEPSLMGLAIGTKGSNIQQCRSLPGIHSIEVNEHSCTFKITGNTVREVLEARKRLEYHCEIVYIPKAYTGRVIGKNGQKIQEIVAKSNVLRVSIESEDENGQVPFQFTGLKESVETAKIVLEYQLANFKELEALVSPTSRNARFSPVSPGGVTATGVEFSPTGNSVPATAGKNGRTGIFPQRNGSTSSENCASGQLPSSSNGVNGPMTVDNMNASSALAAVTASTLTSDLAALTVAGTSTTTVSPNRNSANGAYPAHPRTAMRSMSTNSAQASGNMFSAINGVVRNCSSTSTLPEDDNYTPSAPAVVTATNGACRILSDSSQMSTALTNDVLALTEPETVEANGLLSESNKENVDQTTQRKPSQSNAAESPPSSQAH